MQKENQNVHLSPLPVPRPDTVPIPEAVRAYKPLVKAVAKRYQGRGAEYDDLVQEGCLALLILVPKCPDPQWLALFLKNHLPGYVRDAAARLRRAHAAGKGLPLEELEEILGAEEQNYREIELRDVLLRALAPEEFDITMALLEGCSQREIARALGVSQQAVAARLKIIRKKIKKALNE